MRLIPTLLVTALLASPFAAWCQCKMQSFPIPVAMSGLRAVATVKINGVETPMTVDSGAFFSFLTEAAAAQLGLRLRRVPDGLRAWGLTGSIELHLTKVERLGVQGAEVPNVEFLVGGNEPGGGTMGLLGRNLLSWADAEYDLAHGAIRMMVPEGDCAKTDLAYWAGDTPVVELPLRSSPREPLPAIRVQALINGHAVTALFDTGAVSLLSRKAAKRAGLLDDETRMVPAGTVHGAGSGELPSWLVPVDRFELGGERISNSRLRVADFSLPDADMLIGIDFFLSHRILVARSQQKMYITYHGGPVFDLSMKSDTPVAASSELDEPKDAAGFARRGSALQARRELARALSDFDKACELEPATGAHFSRRGRVHLQLGNPAAAMADFHEALRLDPAEHEARLTRALLNVARTQTEPALEDLQRLDAALAPQSHLRRRMGDAYLALDRPALAFAQYDHWIAFHRNEVDLHVVQNGRCWARSMAGVELDKALADCNDALDAKPQEAAYLDSRGLVHLRQGRFAKALADYDQALKLNPQLAWSLLGRGMARLRMDEREPGLADIAEAKRLRPSIEAEARRHGFELP